jgi:hypothetical protein
MDLISKRWDITELTDKLRTKYPQLTEADLRHEDGKEEYMLRMVEYKLHKTTPEMKVIIDRL